MIPSTKGRFIPSLLLGCTIAPPPYSSFSIGIKVGTVKAVHVPRLNNSAQSALDPRRRSVNCRLGDGLGSKFLRSASRTWSAAIISADHPFAHPRIAHG